MKNIVIFCVNGMSSGLMAQKIQEAANAQHYDAKVISYALGEAPEIAKTNPDCVLVSPQVRYQMRDIKAVMSCPVELINMVSFGRMDGKAMLAQAQKAMGE